jgi:hypothetical protein
MMTLIEIMDNLSSFDPEHTIYAKEPWTVDSAAIVRLEPEEEGGPSYDREAGFTYFLEVFIALETIAALEGRALSMSAKELCEFVIYYAVHDAYP